MAHRPFATYGEFLARLYGQNQFAIKLGLDTIRTALLEEGSPERRAPAILVAGTNGKGSTSAYLGAILQAHGLMVGLYTSPHLVDLRERFRIGGRPVSEALAFEVGGDVLSRYATPTSRRGALTFFELTTLMAAMIFSRASVDVAIYEVGLGGRLDAVNGIEPALSVVTTIDLDHQQYLGDTLEAIASEKCGIFRETAPAIVGFQTHRSALEICRERAPHEVEVAGEDFDEGDLGGAIEHAPQVMRKNAAAAYAAARRYLGPDFDAIRAKEGLESARWPGRLDVRELNVAGCGRRRFLLDAAHNPAGVTALMEFIEAREIPIGAVVCGAMKDKAL
ncbi:MAG: bifunctional folylpolyglutamate synthase/dihydrofolate synthase, partial [Bradymonadaceae bacterium]